MDRDAATWESLKPLDGSRGRVLKVAAGFSPRLYKPGNKTAFQNPVFQYNYRKEEKIHHVSIRNNYHFYCLSGPPHACRLRV
jgi:hypothetical protein